MFSTAASHTSTDLRLRHFDSQAGLLLWNARRPNKDSPIADALCLRCIRYTKSLEPFYDSFDPQFLEVRRVVREVLQKEADLQEIVQLVGKVRPHSKLHVSAHLQSPGFTIRLP